jgi:hypothetical protein
MKEIINFLKLPLVKSFLVLVFIFNIFTICSVSTAKLTEVKLCSSLSSDKSCDVDKSSFPESVDVIYCSAFLKNAPKDTKVTFTWKHGDELLGSADVTSGDAVLYSNYTTKGSLAPGKYSVTLKVNADNVDPVTKEFTIE